MTVYFENHPPRSVKEAKAAIEAETGLVRSETQVRAFMKRLGLRLLKVGCAPGKEMTHEKHQEQQVIHDNELQPRLAEVKKQRHLYFVDAAHFVHGHFLAVLWCFARLFIPSSSGRKRFNVLGALHATTQQLTTITNTTTINAQSVCALLTNIKAAHDDALPITLVLDNARYQRARIVQNCAQALGIELLFPPSYSPNLNLIERLWKPTKRNQQFQI